MVHTVHVWINMYIVYTFYVQDTTVYTVQNTNKPKKKTEIKANYI